MLPKAADMAQNRPLWRMLSKYGAMQSKSYMPETTATTITFSNFMLLLVLAFVAVWCDSLFLDAADEVSRIRF